MITASGHARERFGSPLHWGMPQSTKARAMAACSGERARSASTAAQLVPAGSGDVDDRNAGVKQPPSQTAGNAGANFLDHHRRSQVAIQLFDLG